MEENADMADECLFGFKQGKSTIDSILLLKMIEEWAKLSGTSLCFIATDVIKPMAELTKTGRQMKSKRSHLKRHIS